MGWAWFAVASAATCPDYAQAVVLGDLGESGPTEASGLAASRDRPGVLYTHDDGGEPVLYALDEAGVLVESHGVEGAEVVDWEDLATGPCPDGGNCLYIGDIGDNDGERTWVDIYVAAEPATGESVVVQESWRAQWPGGPVDAETLLVHPVTGEVSLVSKDPSGLSLVGRLPADPGAMIATLEIVATLLLQGNDEGERLAAGGHGMPTVSGWLSGPESGSTSGRPIPAIRTGTGRTPPKPGRPPPVHGRKGWTMARMAVCSTWPKAHRRWWHGRPVRTWRPPPGRARKKRRRRVAVPEAALVPGCCCRCSG